MNPLALLGGAAGGGGMPPISGGDAGPSTATADLSGGSVVLSSPFSVGAGSSASGGNPNAGGAIDPTTLFIVAGAAIGLVLVLVLVRR